MLVLSTCIFLEQKLYDSIAVIEMHKSLFVCQKYTAMYATEKSIPLQTYDFFLIWTLSFDPLLCQILSLFEVHC